MIYKIAFSCEEGDNFRLVFEADPDATFLELHEAILSAVKYNNDQMTSFFMCNDRWEKEQEVTLIEMDRNFDYDNMVKCVEKKGKAPKQLHEEDPLSGIVGKNGKADWEGDENFYGDSQYDEGELDMEGFQDLSFDDGSMF